MIRPTPVRISRNLRPRCSRPRFAVLLFTVSVFALTLGLNTLAAQDAPRANQATRSAAGESETLPAATAQFRKPQRTGEIHLLPGPSPMHEGKILPLLHSGPLGPADQSITAGELWTFFQLQGLDKVESIVLFLDVNKFEDPDSVTIKTIEFRIEPINATLPVTTSALSKNTPLVIPGYDSLSSLPEARLEIPLEFDFMQRFSAESRDRVFLKIIYDAPAGNAPSFFIAGQQSLISLPNFSLLAGFIAFFGGLFYVLARMTLKSTSPAATERRAS